jgi:ribosomal protein S18 acetylase RimI-like enzyme
VDYVLRHGAKRDVKQFTRVDLLHEGYSTSHHGERIALSELRERYRLFQGFVADPDKGSYAADDAARGTSCVGFVLYRIRNLARTRERDVFRLIDRGVFPENGEFVEIFDLWVSPSHRRKGLATSLKKKVEDAAAERRIGAIYTHMEAANTHVVELNEKLGYEEVRRGLIWDDVVRVSMVKRLPGVS